MLRLERHVEASLELIQYYQHRRLPVFRLQMYMGIC